MHGRSSSHRRKVKNMHDALLYTYRAVVISAYDGDTITVDIDLGLGIWARGQKIRLARINTPELRGEEREKGLIARNYVRERLVGKQIVLRTDKDRTGKYGRWVGEVLLPATEQIIPSHLDKIAAQNGFEYVNFNDQLVREGFAEYVSY